MPQDRVSTNVVAADIPMAVSRRWLAPIKGHSPRNCTITKLLTNMVVIRISSASGKC